MVKEPTKLCANPECSRAGERQPWSNFHAKAKWSDGSMRQPHSRCKICQNERAKAWHRAKAVRDPQWLRRRRQRQYASLRANPERWAADLARRREWKRNQAGYRRDLHGFDTGTSPLLPSAPFAAWLRNTIARNRSNARDAAARLGITERTVRAVLNGERRDVELATVERALIADDTCTLRDIYPDLFSEAA